MITVNKVRTAKIRVAIEMIGPLLRLPEHMRVINAMTDDFDCGRPRELILFVETPHLPEVDEGTSAPEILPVYRTGEHGVELLRIENYHGPL